MMVATGLAGMVGTELSVFDHEGMWEGVLPM